jgi:hypothetical protein
MLKLNDFDSGIAKPRLAAVASEVTREEDRQLRAHLGAVAAEACAAASHWDFTAPSRIVRAFLGDRGRFPSAASERDYVRLERAAVARLALEHFRVGERLPNAVIALYPEFFRRLARFLAERVGDRYEDDYFAKDVRYALGLTVPAGALQFDPIYRIGPKLILREIARLHSPRPAWHYIGACGLGRWYNVHLDTRAVKEFTPEGWTRAFVTVAGVLAMNPSVRGAASAGWLFDPQLAEVSPELGYIQTPMKHGAFRIRIGSGADTVRNATRHSAVRRKACEEGRYAPAAFLMAWPRTALIAWARRLESDVRLQFGGPPSAQMRRPVSAFGT